MIENPRTGEQVEFVSESPEVLTMLTVWARPGHRAAEHVHPRMEERFEVLEGRAAFRIDGVEIEVPSEASWSPHQAAATWRGTLPTRPFGCVSRCVPPCAGGNSPPASSAVTTPSSSSPEYADEVQLPPD